MPAALFQRINSNPSDPLSTVGSGFTIVRRQTDVEGDVAKAVKQAQADDMADQRTYGLDTRFFPIVEDDAAHITNGPHGIAKVGVLTKRTLTCEPGQHMQLTFREVL